MTSKKHRSAIHQDAKRRRPHHLESLELHKNWGDRREVDNLPFGRLLARVGRGPWVDAGSEKAVRFLDSGELMLRINDNDGSLADNAGAPEIEVEVHAPGDRAR